MSTNAQPVFRKIRPGVYVCHSEAGYGQAMVDFWKREPDENERPIRASASYPCVAFFWSHYIGCENVIKCTLIPVDEMWASLQGAEPTT